MNKTIILILMTFSLLGCHKNFVPDDMISKTTEKIMLEKQITPAVIEEKNDNEYEEETVDKSEVGDITTDIIPNVEEEIIIEEEIECVDVDECINISMPIQQELNDSIDSVYYREIKNKNNELTGYVIDYTFKEHTYKTYEECMEKASILSDKLSNKIFSYSCDDGTLLIEGVK